MRQARLELYNTCRILFSQNGNKQTTAGILGITPARLRRVLAADLDEYRLLCFLFAPTIRDAFAAIRKEPLFSRKNARKYYDIYRDQIRAFKRELQRTPWGDHFDIYWRMFHGQGAHHERLQLATDHPRHRSLYSIIMTLHLCKYRRRSAAARLGMSVYRLNKALQQKPDECKLIILLLIHSPQKAGLIARKLRLPPRPAVSRIRAAHRDKISEYRRRLKSGGADPYGIYQIVFKGHIPGRAGFDLSILKKMQRVYRTRATMERGNLPLLFSLPDAFLHQQLLEKVRQSSSRFWGEAMRVFIQRERLPFTYAELNRREEEHRRGLLARQVIATTHRDEQERQQRDRAEPTKQELLHDAPSGHAPAAPRGSATLFAEQEHIPVRDGMVGEDSIHWYLARIENLPILADGEERALVIAAQQGSRQARRQLVDANLKLVFSLAKPLQGRGLELMDLVSEGNFGMLHAIKRYRPERNVRFSTYATYWIRKYLHEAIARNLGLSTYHYEQLLKLRRAIRVWSDRHQRTPSLDELQETSGIARDEIEKLLPLAMGDISLDSGTQADNSISISDTLVDQQRVTDKLLIDKATTDTLNDILRRYLAIREELVIRYHMGFGPGFVTMPLEDIGNMLGVSRTAAQMIEKSALDKLSDPAVKPLLQDLL